MRRAGGLLLVAAAMACALSGCAPSQEITDSSAAASPTGALKERTIAVVGDSISLGVNACGHSGACEAASWAIGTDESVDSIAARWKEETGVAPGTVSAAAIGAASSDAARAVAALEGSSADVVLVLLGANDACTPSLQEVTPVARFATRYGQLLSGIRDALPDARIVAYSLPNLLNLWKIGRDDPEAVRMWSRSPSCTSLLGNAQSDAEADVDRRAAIEATLSAYDTAIVDACAAVAGCVSDGGAVAATEFTAGDISPIDHFHPSTAGQAALAEAAWPAARDALESVSAAEG